MNNLHLCYSCNRVVLLRELSAITRLTNQTITPTSHLQDEAAIMEHHNSIVIPRCCDTNFLLSRSSGNRLRPQVTIFGVNLRKESSLPRHYI